MTTMTRRQMLTSALKGASLVSLGSVVPQFVARTAHAAAPGKDNILVVVELTGGNDGLNTVVPYGDDEYRKHRPKLAIAAGEVKKVDDRVASDRWRRFYGEWLTTNRSR